MKRKLILVSGVLLIIFSLTFISPTQASANWGVEVDKTYKYELKTLKILGTDYAAILPKDQFTFKVVFTDLLSNGYNYQISNNTMLLLSNTTTFETVEIPEVDNFTLPVGLPVALPLQIDLIEDYLSYFGMIVNQTQSFIVTEDLLANITDYATNFNMVVNTTLDEKYLKIDSYATADMVNASFLSELLAEADTGLPITIPANLTDFNLVISFAYNATSGLFDSVILKLRSMSVQYGFEEAFNVDIKFALYVAPSPQPTPTPTPTDTSFYPWLIPTLVVFAVLGVMIRRRKS